MPGKGNGCRSPKRTVRSTDAERPPGAVRTGSGPGARRRGLARPGRRADRAGRFPLVRPQLPGIHCHPGVGERHRGPRTAPPHRVHRADLPGSRGVCGHRRVHLGAADVEARRHLVARLAGRRHCRRGLWVSRRAARAAAPPPLRHIEPQSFTLVESIFYFAMIVIGGLASIPGALIGAVVLTVLPQQLTLLREWVPAELAQSMIYSRMNPDIYKNK